MWGLLDTWASSPTRFYWSSVPRRRRSAAGRQGYDLQPTQYDDRGGARRSHDRDGGLADERDGHRVGAHAVAHDAAGGVGDAQTSIEQPGSSTGRRRK